jgi:hypothetical protein
LIRQDFDPDDHLFQELYKQLKSIEYAKQLDPESTINKEKDSGNNDANNGGNASNSSKNKKQECCKHQNDNDNVNSHPNKKKCMLHDMDSHTMDDCLMLQKQVKNMKATWAARSSSE